MVQSGVPGFNTSPRHIDYIRAAYQGGPSGVPYRLVDPATAKPAPGDLLCFLRDRSTTLSYSGLVQALGNGSVGHWNRIAKWWWRPTSAATRPCTWSVAT